MNSKHSLHRLITVITILYSIIIITSCSAVNKTLTKEHTTIDSTAKKTTQTISVSKTDSIAASVHITANQSGVIIDFDTINIDSIAGIETGRDIFDVERKLSITDPSDKIIDAIVAKIKSGRLRPKAVHVYNNTTETKKDSVIKTKLDSTASVSTDYIHVVTETSKKSKVKSKTVPRSVVIAGSCLLLLFLLLLLIKKVRDKITGIWKF